jgi:hypothetical protein
MQIPQNVINMLSAKGKGYVEAAMKIAEGQRLMNEGTIEIAALDGKKKILKAGGVDMLSSVRDLAKPKITPEYLKTFLRAGPLSARDLAAKAGCAHETARRTLVEAEDPELQRIGTGNKTAWTLSPASSRITKKTKVANKTTRRKKEPGDFGTQTPRCKMVLEAVQKDPWMTTTRIAKEVLGYHGAASTCCKLLEKAGMIWKVEKANNPAHTGQSVHRTLEYWEADPKAKIEVANMHVPRMQVKDPTTLYPAIEAAIRAANGWASKRFLENHTKLSGGPLNRVIKAMKKDGHIESVWKKHNPSHKQPKNFEREALYWELTGRGA